MVLDDAVEAMLKELTRATEMHPRLNSVHEGYAVLLEEMDELWDEIKSTGPHKNNPSHVRTEAIHVAAMALRFLVECVE